MAEAKPIPTLDQQRAKFAWDAVQSNRQKLAKFSDYKKLAKGAPALIMGNGLMPALAFYASRKKDHADALRDDILAALNQRFARDPAWQPLPRTFSEAMDRLTTVRPGSGFYMRATDEALAMLKWLRQFADAIDAQANTK